MFGCLAAYVQGRMVMVLTEDPGDKTYRGKSYGFDIWDGIMFPTERAFQESLIKEFPGLVPHPVLGKWLYLPAQHDDFEGRAKEIAGRIAQGDKRLGIEPEVRVRPREVKRQRSKGKSRSVGKQ